MLRKNLAVILYISCMLCMMWCLKVDWGTGQLVIGSLLFMAIGLAIIMNKYLKFQFSFELIGLTGLFSLILIHVSSLRCGDGSISKLCTAIEGMTCAGIYVLYMIFRYNSIKNEDEDDGYVVVTTKHNNQFKRRKR